MLPFLARVDAEDWSPCPSVLTLKIDLQVEFLVHSVPYCRPDPTKTPEGKKQPTLESNSLSPSSQGHCSAWGGMWVVKAGKITQV